MTLPTLVKQLRAFNRLAESKKQYIISKEEKAALRIVIKMLNSFI